MLMGSFVPRLRRLGRQPLVLAAVAAVIVLVCGAVAVVRLDSAPAAATPKIVYVPTPTPVPGPTQTVVRTKTKTVVVTASPSPATSRTPSGAVQLRCSAPQVTLTLTTNKPRYAQGETVRLTATLRRSDPPNGEYQHFDPRPCVVDPGGFTVYLTDDEQQPVYPAARCCLGVYAIYVPYNGAQFYLANGASHVVTYTWDGQTRYPGTAGNSPAYAGDYHAVAQWMYPYADSAQITFHLNGPAAP